MVATVETISEPELHSKRCGASISSAPSVVKKSSSMNSAPGIWNTLIHREAAEVNGGPTRIDDQKFGSSDGLFIDPCSLIFERSAGANEIIYCGYRFDPESDLYYVRNRSCSAAIGRWIQRDPVGYESGINLYAHVWGTAAVTVDPEGMAGVPVSQPTTAPAKCRCPKGYKGLGGFLVTEYIMAHEADYPGDRWLRPPALVGNTTPTSYGRFACRGAGRMHGVPIYRSNGRMGNRRVPIRESYPERQRIAPAGWCYSCRGSSGDSAENVGVYSECWLA